MEEMERRIQPEQPADEEVETPEAAPDPSITFDEAKTRIRNHIVTAAKSFIAIGYYLKLVRDRRLYDQDGYASVWDFAAAEYGISKSTASRYMTMNDRFSEGGNGLEVAEEYRGYGRSQLQEMLYLTDDQLDEVTPETQVRQIREIRQPAREIPYVELPGQLRIEDFPDFMPEPVEPEWIPMPRTGSAVFTLADLAKEDEAESVAMSQQDDSEDDGSLPCDDCGACEEFSGYEPRQYGTERTYTIADVERDMANHLETLTVLGAKPDPPPIVRMSRMRLDAILLLWDQMERETDPESRVRCTSCGNDVEIYDGYKYCPYCGGGLWD